MFFFCKYGHCDSLVVLSGRNWWLEGTSDVVQVQIMQLVDITSIGKMQKCKP
jgi:hypothetical protein